MPKRKPVKVDETPAPKGIKELTFDFKAPNSLRTQEIHLFAAALDVSVDLILDHFCSCLNRKLAAAVQSYEHLWDHPFDNFVGWVRKSYEFIEIHYPIFPSAEAFIALPAWKNLVPSDIKKMRALVNLKYRDFQVCFFFRFLFLSFGFDFCFCFQDCLLFLGSYFLCEFYSML
jgi:hypothetical protein